MLVRPWVAEMLDLWTMQLLNSRGAIAQTTQGSLPVSERSLEPNEFRLICLLATDDQADDPIHLTLHTYRDDDSPEYETISYTWSDEQGRITRSKQIYVGDYWDLLPLTSDCWSLLRYLRPSRLQASRLLWFDVICIDQENVFERDNQVSKMAAIYRRCTRVVVWLGEDIIHEPITRHRQRYSIVGIQHKVDHELLKKLPGRRYFSRVWIIQELVFAPRSIVPILDMDFVADRSTLMKLVSDETWDWETVGTTWLQHTHNGNSSQDMDLYFALWETRKSQATDPRDQVFGVLGLIDNHDIVPNYSLSVMSTFIGVSAYLLPNLRRVDILLMACGNNPPPSHPSWMPDWQHCWNKLGGAHAPNRDEDEFLIDSPRA